MRGPEQLRDPVQQLEVDTVDTRVDKYATQGR
jgi:hypothetical protein